MDVVEARDRFLCADIAQCAQRRADVQQLLRAGVVGPEILGRIGEQILDARVRRLGVPAGRLELEPRRVPVALQHQPEVEEDAFDQRRLERPAVFRRNLC